MGLIEQIKAEWPTLKGAPVAFLSIAILSVVTGFGGGVLFKDQQVSALEALMRLKDGELDSYRKQIEERLGAVERQLSAAQVQSMVETLQAAPSSVLLWNYPEQSGPLINQLEGIFNSSGWEVAPYAFAKAPPQSSKPLFVSLPEDASGDTLKAAIEQAGVPYDFETTSGPAAIWVNPKADAWEEMTLPPTR